MLEPIELSDLEGFGAPVPQEQHPAIELPPNVHPGRARTLIVVVNWRRLDVDGEPEDPEHLRGVWSYTYLTTISNSPRDSTR